MNIDHIDHCFELVTFQCETCINLVFALADGDVTLEAPDTCNFMAYIVHVNTKA